MHVRRKLIKERMYCKREGRLSKKKYYRYLLLTLNRIKKISHNTTFLSVFLYIQYTYPAFFHYVCVYFQKMDYEFLLEKDKCIVSYLILNQFILFLEIMYQIVANCVVKSKVNFTRFF